MDIQPVSKPGFTQPIGGMIVILLVALLVGGWLYVDMVRNELEMKVAAVYSELAALKSPAKQGQDAKDSTPPVTEQRRIYVSSLDDYGFQLDLPEGYHVYVRNGALGDTSAYVISDTTNQNPSPTPDMVISLVNLKNQQYASKLGNDEPGTRLVATPDLKWAFWIRGWEDMSWSQFDKVAASFKAL